MNSKAFKNLVKMLKTNAFVLNYNKYCIKKILPYQAMTYSTNITKSMDILDLFTDHISNKFEAMPIERNSPLKRTMLSQQGFPKKSKVDQIISDMHLSNLDIACKMLVNQLSVSMETMNYSDINKIINFCILKEIPLPGALLRKIAGIYSNAGLIEELSSVVTLSKLTNEEEFYEQGEFLHYSAFCYWIYGNNTKFVELLRESSDKYPEMKELSKKLLKLIIPQVISSRSLAELVIVIEFLKEFTDRFKDYYVMTVLWNELFLSQWFADQELADKLLSSDEDLQKCVSLIVPSLVSHLLSTNKVDDVYRILSVLLKYQLMDRYSLTLQILFDHFCVLDDKRRCAEIIKSSIELKAPLRKEQYDQFISWSVCGDPFKLVKKSEVEKIYSSF